MGYGACSPSWKLMVWELLTPDMLRGSLSTQTSLCWYNPLSAVCLFLTEIPLNIHKPNVSKACLLVPVLLQKLTKSSSFSHIVPFCHAWEIAVGDVG